MNLKNNLKIITHRKFDLQMCMLKVLQVCQKLKNVNT